MNVFYNLIYQSKNIFIYPKVNTQLVYKNAICILINQVLFGNVALLHSFKNTILFQFSITSNAIIDF